MSLIFKLIKEIAEIENNNVRKQYLKINFWSNLELEICLENIGKKAIDIFPFKLRNCEAIVKAIA